MRKNHGEQKLIHATICDLLKGELFIESYTVKVRTVWAEYLWGNFVLSHRFESNIQDMEAVATNFWGVIWTQVHLCRCFYLFLLKSQVVSHFIGPKECQIVILHEENFSQFCCMSCCTLVLMLISFCLASLGHNQSKNSFNQTKVIRKSSKIDLKRLFFLLTSRIPRKIQVSKEETCAICLECVCGVGSQLCCQHV